MFFDFLRAGWAGGAAALSSGLAWAIDTLSMAFGWFAALTPQAWSAIVAACALILTRQIARGQRALGLQQAAIAASAVRLSREKLKVDLFERRVAVYDAATTLLNQVLGSGTCSREQKLEFERVSSPAKWLFGEKVRLYFDGEISGVLLDLFLVQHEAQHLEAADFERRRALNDREVELLAELLRKTQALDTVMGPYLHLQIPEEPAVLTAGTP